MRTSRQKLLQLTGIVVRSTSLDIELSGQIGDELLHLRPIVDLQGVERCQGPLQGAGSHFGSKQGRQVPVSAPSRSEFEGYICGFEAGRGDYADKGACIVRLPTQGLLKANPGRQSIPVYARCADPFGIEAQRILKQIDQRCNEVVIERTVADEQIKRRRWRHKSSHSPKNKYSR